MSMTDGEGKGGRGDEERGEGGAKVLVSSGTPPPWLLGC